MDERESVVASGRPETAESSRPPRGVGAVVRWVVIAVLAVTVFTLGGVGVLAALFASGNAELSHRIMAVLNDAIGTDSTRIVCDRVHGTLFRGAVLDHPRLLVRTPEREVTWASADRISVDYDLLALLLSSRRALRVTLDAPAVTLSHDAGGAIVFPKFASRPARGGSPVEAQIRIAVRRGRLSLDWEGARFRNIQGSARVVVARESTTVTLENLTATPDSLAGAEGSITSRGAMSITGSTLRVDPVSLSYGSSRVTARFDWDLSRGRAADGVVAFEPLQVADALRFAGIKNVYGTLHGEARFQGIPSDGRASARLAGEVSGVAIDTVLAEARFTPRAISVTSMRVRVQGAEVTGSGTVEERGRLLAALRFHDVDPSRVPWLSVPAGVPSGRLAGTARIEARRARPRPSVAADVSLEPSRLGRLRVRRGALRLRLAPDGSATLDSGWVDVPGGTILGGGTLGADRQLDLSVRGRVDDLAAIDSVLVPLNAVSGTGRFVAVLNGALPSPAFTARADVWGARLSNGVSCDSLVANAHGIVAANPAARVTLSVRGIRVNGRPFGNAQAVARVGKSIVVEAYRQAIGDTVLTWRGGVTFTEHGGEAVIDSMRLAAGALGFRNLEPVRIRFGGGKVHAAPLSLDLDPGRLDVDVDWDVKRGRIDARGAIQGFDVRRIPGSRAPRNGIEGEMRGQFILSGAVNDPELNLWLDVLHPTWGAVEGDTLSLSVAYAPGVLTIERARWAEGRGSLHLEGTARTAMTLETWLRAIGRKDGAWPARTELALKATLDSLSLDEFNALSPKLATLSGRASLAADIRGTAASPLIRIRGSSPGLSYQGVSGVVTGLEANYANRSLTISRCDIVQEKSTSSITGELPVDLSLFGPRRLLRDEPLRLRVRVTDLDFKLASIVSSAIASSAGRLTATADVSGTAEKPKVVGSVHLEDGTLRLAGRDEVLESVQVDGTFDEGQLTVTKASAREGRRGKLSGSGTWRWSTPAATAAVAAGPPGEYAFTIKATDFTTSDRVSYLFRLTGTFTISNGRTEEGKVIPKITGSAVLSSGNLTLNLSEPTEEPPPLPFQYDVTVDVPGGLFYRTVDSDVELTGTLRLKNDGDGDIALGTMTVKKGKYYFFTREIGDLSGELVFNSVDRIDPELAVDGQTSIRTGSSEHVINVSLTGRASEPKVHLWDAEGTSQADLWRAITFGQFTSFGTQDLATGGTSSGASPDLTLPIKDYLFRNAERWLSSSGFIDTIDLRSGARSGNAEGTATAPLETGTTVGVGKYVTRDLYLNYSRDFYGQADYQINAEYRVTRHLLLKGQRIERTQTDPEYNLDLKIRLEY